MSGDDGGDAGTGPGRILGLGLTLAVMFAVLVLTFAAIST